MSDDDELNLKRGKIAERYQEFESLWKSSSQAERMSFNAELDRLQRAAHYRYRCDEIKKLMDYENSKIPNLIKFCVYVAAANLIFMIFGYAINAEIYLLAIIWILFIVSSLMISSLFIISKLYQSANVVLYRLFHEFSDDLVPASNDYQFANELNQSIYNIWRRNVDLSNDERLDLDFEWITFCIELLEKSNYNLTKSKIDNFNMNIYFYGNPSNKFPGYI